MIEGGMMRRAIAAAFAVMIGAAVSQFFYAGLVPPFPKFLVVATALASGMYLRSWREIALAAFLPAIAWQTYETWVLRAPMLFWMVGGLFLTAEVAAVLTAGRLTRLGAQRLTSEWRRWGRGYEIGGPFPLESTSSRIGFGADLASAAQALISQPSVPLVSLAVWLLPDGVIAWTFPGHHSLVLSLLGLAIMLATLFFQLGWYGAERVFFQRRLRDEPVAGRHPLGLVGPFIGRFFAAGLPFGIVLSGFYFTAFRVHRPVGGPMPGRFHVGAGLWLLGMDFALTFVTPALAYTTRSALRAMGIGFAMIRQTWPRSALYVLCPPLALNLLQVIHPVSGHTVGLAISSVLVLISLLAKGAIAAFYLRERGSYSDDGAAYITAQDEPAEVLAGTAADHLTHPSEAPTVSS